MLEDWFASSERRASSHAKALGTRLGRAIAASIAQPLCDRNYSKLVWCSLHKHVALWPHSSQKNPMAIVRVHAEVRSRCATHTYTHARAHVHILSISLRFERREYLREGVARAVRNGSSYKATAIQATDMRFTSRGLAWRKTNERSLHAVTQIFTPFEAK